MLRVGSVHLVEGFHGEVDAGAVHGESSVLLRHRLHFSHDHVCLFHLFRDFCSFLLQFLQSGNDAEIDGKTLLFFRCYTKSRESVETQRYFGLRKTIEICTRKNVSG